MQFLRASTAYTFRIGQFVDETNGVTVETALTITQALVRLSKAGGDFAPMNAAASPDALVHDENGYYILPLDTTDTNTPGTLEISITTGGSSPQDGALWVRKEFQVVAAPIYDTMYSANPTLISGTVTDSSPTATNFETGTSLTGQGFSTDDQLNNRYLVFDKDTTTAALRGQGTPIADYISTNGEIVVCTNELTTAPASTDSFVIY